VWWKIIRFFPKRENFMRTFNMATAAAAISVWKKIRAIKFLGNRGNKGHPSR